MSLHFTIPGRLPGMNEMLTAAKQAHGLVYARMKKRATGDVRLLVPPMALAPPVFLLIDWYEKDEKRDFDNVTAGQKFILDALKGKTLPEDNRRHVTSVSNRVHTDAANPRIEVSICEVREVIVEHPHGQGLRKGSEASGLPSPASV